MKQAAVYAAMVASALPMAQANANIKVTSPKQMKHAGISAAIFKSAATMAHANADINIDSSKTSMDAKAFAKSLLDKQEFADLINSNLKDLSVAMKLDDQSLKIDVGTLIASFEGGDSTIQNIYDPSKVMGCYSNCYTNCHGSRSWR